MGGIAGNIGNSFGFTPKIQNAIQATPALDSGVTSAVKTMGGTGGIAALSDSSGTNGLNGTQSGVGGNGGSGANGKIKIYW